MFLKIFTTFVIILIYKISISYTYRTIIVPQGWYVSAFGNVTWNDENINSVKAALNNTKYPEKSDVKDVTKNKEFFLYLYAGGSDYDIGDFFVNITYKNKSEPKSLVKQIPDNCTNKDSFNYGQLELQDIKEYACNLGNITLDEIKN